MHLKLYEKGNLVGASFLLEKAPCLNSLQNKRAVQKKQ